MLDRPPSRAGRTRKRAANSPGAVRARFARGQRRAGLSFLRGQWVDARELAKALHDAERLDDWRVPWSEVEAAAHAIVRDLITRWKRNRTRDARRFGR
jgi:uncharacterized membrane protein